MLHYERRAATVGIPTTDRMKGHTPTTAYCFDILYLYAWERIADIFFTTDEEHGFAVEVRRAD